MAKTPAKPVHTPVAVPWRLVVLSLAIPGLGLWLAGWRYHAALFGVAVLGLFATGMAWSGMTAMDQNGHPIYFLMQLGAGLPAWIIAGAGLAAEPLIGETVGVTQQMIGVCQVAVAGILNVLGALCVARFSVLRLSLPTESNGGAKA